MAAITDLAAASSVAATDNLVINQSGTDRKVTADKFVTTDGAGKTAAVKQVTQQSVTLAANATQALTSTFGLLVLQNASSGGQGLLWLAGAGGAAIINQTGTNISTVTGTASKLNVYYLTGTYFVENKFGTSQTIYYMVIGS
jgi:hypothetical protein